MTPLVLLLPLLAAQTEAPPPATTAPPVLRMEGSTAAQPTPAPAPVPAAATPAPAPADAPAAAPPSPGTRGAPVYLTINSNRSDVQLLSPDRDDPVCTVPCNRLVPAGPKDKYFLGGNGLTNSNDFDLAEGIKAARIDVRAGKRGGKIAGIILTAVGLPFVLSGGLSMASWGIQQDPAIQAQIAASGQTQLISPTVTLVIALVELIVGAAAGTAGLILWPMNTTTMKVTPIEPPAVTEAPAAPVEPAPAPPAEPATAP